MDDATLMKRDSVDPYLILATAVLGQICAGTMYWFPAITPGISESLHLTQQQSTILIAVANTGSVFGLIGGLINQRIGTRLTASYSAIGVSISYFSLALLTFSNISPDIGFLIAFLLIATLVTTSYPLYSCSIAASIAVFPVTFRGRIVGLNSITYGGAAGLLTAFQSVFFTKRSQIAGNLFFISAYALGIAAAVRRVFPRHFIYDVDRMQRKVVSHSDQQHEDIGEHQSLLPRQEEEEEEEEEFEGYTEREAEREVEEEIEVEEGGNEMNVQERRMVDKDIRENLGVAYKIAIAFLVTLQVSAVAGILQVGYIYQVGILFVLSVSYFAILYLPFTSCLTVVNKVSSSTSSTFSSAGEPSLWQAMTDWRGVYIEAGCITLTGGGGVFLLVQSKYLVQSLQLHGLWTDRDTDLIVRWVVTLFVACSVTGRVIIGSIFDRALPTHRVQWAFTLLRVDFLIMAAAMSILAIPSKAALIVGICAIGLSYGAYFVVAPALTTLFFGVKCFPRNFAVFGGMGVIASLSINSYVPDAIRGVYGIENTLPILVPSIALQVMMYVAGGRLEAIVLRRGYLG